MMNKQLEKRRFDNDPDASRLFPRHAIDLRLKLVVQGKGRARVIHARSKDLSYSGIGVTATEAPMCGTDTLVWLRIRHHEFVFSATVMHASGFRCGLRFDRMTGEQKLVIQKICQIAEAHA